MNGISIYMNLKEKKKNKEFFHRLEENNNSMIFHFKNFNKNVFALVFNRENRPTKEALY